MRARLVLLASGNGSTAQGFLDAAADGRLGADVVALGADRDHAHALERARRAGVETFVVRREDHPDRPAYDAAVGDALDARRPDLVACCGWMKVLAPDVVGRHRVVNTHPSLLPAFPGAHALRDQLAGGTREGGCTVHVVDAGVDTGPALARARVPVLPDDDEDALRARVQGVERDLYVDVVADLLAGGVEDLDRRIEERTARGADG